MMGRFILTAVKIKLLTYHFEATFSIQKQI